MSQPIKLTILHDPTSSAKGKFYIGLEHNLLSITIHGPKSHASEGTVSELTSSIEVRKKLTEKRRKGKGYVPATLSDLPHRVVSRMRERAAQVFPNSKPEDLQITDTKIFDPGLTGSSTQTNKKPRRRKAALLDVWI